MTALPSTPGADAVRPMLAAYVADERHWHARWARHVRMCLACSNGRQCRIANRYASNTDAANERLLIAEMIERVSGGRR